MLNSSPFTVSLEPQGSGLVVTVLCVALLALALPGILVSLCFYISRMFQCVAAMTPPGGLGAGKGWHLFDRREFQGCPSG